MARTLLDAARDDYLRDRCDIDEFETRVERLLVGGLADEPDPIGALRDRLEARFSGPTTSTRLMVLP